MTGFEFGVGITIVVLVSAVAADYYTEFYPDVREVHPLLALWCQRLARSMVSVEQGVGMVSTQESFSHNVELYVLRPFLLSKISSNS